MITEITALISRQQSFPIFVSMYNICKVLKFVKKILLLHWKNELLICLKHCAMQEKMIKLIEINVRLIFQMTLILRL